MKQFTEWMEVRDSLGRRPSEVESQAHSLKGIERGIENIIQQVQGFVDPRKLVKGESRQELVRIANSIMGEGQYIDNLKSILVAQYKTGRRDASDVVRAADIVKKSASSLVMANNDAEKNDDLGRLSRATSDLSKSLSSLYYLLHQYAY
jgi:hypothetical protein